ncbi:hypothetical protein [Azospirillum soli]|uniref:hypothetical protein n=1 Tax=Azospirillum soli TaxID=1304799 RepID=UPI001AE5FC88|nr:hypothetical protein [Azospirillum soli]MBP2316576.1 hypothetical protein [Azospirillum soli]
MSSAIVFVHLGDALPPYLDDALAQARLFNEGEILLIGNAAAMAATPPDPALGIRLLPVEELPVSPKLETFRQTATTDRAFRFGFWTYVIERFFHVEAAMAALGLTNVLHLETDNLLYADTEQLCPELERLYPGLAVPFDNDRRGIAGLMYARDAAAMGSFTHFIAEFFARNPGVRINDMILLGLFRERLGPAFMDALPVIPTGGPPPVGSLAGHTPADPAFYSRNFDAIQAVFDTGALGQYLGGVDPRNVRGRRTVGFLNESAVYQPSNYRFRLIPDAEGRRIPHLGGTGPEGGERFWPIVNLHIHSKDLAVHRSRPPIVAVPPAPPPPAIPADLPEAEIITGERLQALADISVIDDSTYAFHTSLRATPAIRLCRFAGPRNHLTVEGAAQLRELQRASVIFVYPYLLDSFILHILPHLTQRFVLVCHNSDHRIGDRYRPFLDDVRLIHCFAQNAETEHPKLSALPIGLANAQWPHGDTAALSAVAREDRPKTGLLYANFEIRTNRAARQPIFDLLKDKPFVTQSPPKPYRPYLEELASHRFCISPPGNGPDCHRTWEAVSLGVIPIVQTGTWMRSFADLPLVAVDRWDIIDEAFLEREYQRIQATPRRLDKAMVGYWRNQIRSALRAGRDLP